ncbi:MAG: pre-peptidase C-terminal domain-containing protein, partial [Acidobacteria bacterium]|nr:pre-peptidase C-terminal domain-containing protein [Acidobacteriota bacterium]
PNITPDFGRLPQTGTYRVVANSTRPGDSGSYTVTLNVAATNCSSASINVGETKTGKLQQDDCHLPADDSFMDVYTFNGTAGQQINITMAHPPTSGLDPYLFLLSPSGSVLFQDDDGLAPSPNLDARIPAGSGNVTLTATGVYTIYADAATPGNVGDYSLTLAGTQVCTYSLTSTARTVSAGGGTFTTDAFTTQAGCAAPSVASNTTSFITAGTAAVNASGQGTFSYTVAANSTTAARSGMLTVGGQTFTVNQDAACAAGVFPASAPFTQSGGTGRLSVFPTGQCSWTVSTATPWIHITTPAGGGTGTGNGRVRFSVDANGGASTRTGTINVGTATFTVTETSAGTTPQVQFSSAAYSVNENDASKSVTITVSRTGDTAGAVTVDYATVDDPAPVPCDPNARDSNNQPFPHGKAYARCDYATTIDTLTFNPGETTKTFVVPLINDTHFEGAETFQVALSNPQGALLGTPATATVTIGDDETAQATTNPSRQAAFFVRQQYLDFLNREPDPDGFALWTGLFNGCSNQDNFDPNNPAHFCDRVAISSGFFLSQEFQLKGFFVFLYWKVSFATQSDPNYYPAYEEIVPDMRRVTGSSANEVFAKRNDFAEDWVNRPAFKARYDVITNNGQFVDTLLSNVGATLSTADPNSGETRNSLVAALDAATKTRADVLRVIVESKEVNDRQFNAAFVAMQYYGYLRRKPDPGGYGDWFGFLSNHPGDFRTMVFGFVNSDEYYLRFGPNVRQ